jgi:hypothetical protein
MHVGGELVDTPKDALLDALAMHGAEQALQSIAACQYNPAHCTVSHWEVIGGAGRPNVVHSPRSTTIASPEVPKTSTHCTVRVR